jgi:lipopolysaccharide transport system permease protein
LCLARYARRINFLSLPRQPFAVFQSFWKHRTLIFNLARRDVLGRYSGSFLGLMWSFFNPLLMLCVYTFVFGVVFKARWSPNESASILEFAVVLFAGLLVFGIFSECVNRAPSLMLQNPGFVKRVIFPLEIMPWVVLCSSLFHTLISLIVLALVMLIGFGSLPYTWPLIVLVLLPLVLFVMGIAWALAALGVYLRDLSQTINIVTTVMMYLSPIFYPASAVPEGFRWAIEWNPMSAFIEQTRAVLIWGRLPDFASIAAMTAGGLAVAWLGLALFQHARDGFADVL